MGEVGQTGGRGGANWWERWGKLVGEVGQTDVGGGAN